jgi:hypothetical protein
MRWLVSAGVALALVLLAGAAVAAPPPSPAKYSAGQLCEDAMAQGRTLIRTEVDRALTLITHDK